MLDRAIESELTPVTAMPLPTVRRVLVLAPHPDDEVFGCGGTLNLLAKAGAAISVIVASDGSLGGAAGDGQAETLVAARETETRAAAEILGYPPPVFWRLPDRGLRYGDALIDRIQEAVRGVDAELVFAPALSEVHPDHQTLALAAAEALRQIGGERRLAFYEVSAPLLPNALIDITAAEALKGAAMRCFATQEAQQPYAECVAALNRYRSYTLSNVAHAAEAFFIVSSSDLADGAARLFESAMGRRRRLGIALDGTELPLVSVIVRSAGEPSLGEALASVAAQTYPNLEAVVVDMAPGTSAPLPDFGGRYLLQRLKTSQARNRARAANAGLDAAKGRFMLLLDEKDLLLPDHVAKLVDALRQSGTGAAYSGVRLADADDRTLWVLDEPWEPAHLLGENFLPVPAVLFDRSLLKAGCRFDEGLDALEEWDFWLQAVRHGKFIHVPGVSAITRGARTTSGDMQHVESRLAQRAAVLAKWCDRHSAKDWETAMHWLVRRREEALARAAATERDSALLAQQKIDLANENRTITARGDALATSNSALARNNAELTQQSAALAQSIAELTRQAADLARSIAGLTQDNAVLTQHNAALAHSNATLVESNEGLAQSNAHLMKDQAALIENIASQTRNNAVLTQHNATLAHNNALLTEQNAGLASQVSATRQELSAMQASTSWRITAPLRWLVGLFRR